MFSFVYKRYLILSIALSLFIISNGFAGHFSFSRPNTNSFMSLIGDSFLIDGKPAEASDEIAVFDQGGVLCGFFTGSVVSDGTPHGFFNFTVFGDDTSTTSIVEGASIYEELTIIVWDASEGVEIHLNNTMITPKAAFGIYSPVDSVPPTFKGDNGTYGLDINAYQKPVVLIHNQSNSMEPVKSKTWNWSADSTSTFRFAINQNPAWQPIGNFTNTQTATKSNADGIWYLHIQAKDTHGNFSDVKTASALLDNTKPTLEISNTLNQWQWSANETCTFRFAVNQNLTWEASGNFTSTTRTTLNQGEGTWYLHVQAKDRAGNISDIQSKSVTLEKPTVQFKTAYSENFEHSTSVRLELKLSRIIDNDVTISYICESTDAFLDKDYFLPEQLIATIASGNLIGYIEFTVVDDHRSEPDGSIIFSLQGAENATLSWKLNHTYTIKDNDYPDISVTQIDDPIVISARTKIEDIYL